eukprot:353214-Chlamydomonas_euryale.AAC.5
MHTGGPATDHMPLNGGDSSPSHLVPPAVTERPKAHAARCAVHCPSHHRRDRHVKAADAAAAAASAPAYAGTHRVRLRCVVAKLLCCAQHVPRRRLARTATNERQVGLHRRVLLVLAAPELPAAEHLRHHVVLRAGRRAAGEQSAAQEYRQQQRQRQQQRCRHCVAPRVRRCGRAQRRLAVRPRFRRRHGRALARRGRDAAARRQRGCKGAGAGEAACLLRNARAMCRRVRVFGGLQFIFANSFECEMVKCASAATKRTTRCLLHHHE